MPLDAVIGIIIAVVMLLSIPLLLIYVKKSARYLRGPRMGPPARHDLFNPPWPIVENPHTARYRRRHREGRRTQPRKPWMKER